MTKKKQIENLRTKVMSRGWQLAKTGLKAGGLAAGQVIKSALASAEQKDSVWTQYVLKQVQVLTQELGQLKGSAMKVGQLLSTYGEHFLPKEANDILKSLQSQSPSVAWPTMQKALEKELGAEKLAHLEIEPTPWASASIGQVHRARRGSDELAMKIQYPGVDGAIETDLKFLKTILAMGPILPKGPRFDAVFEEVRSMLYREVNYENEIRATLQMGEYLKKDPRYVVSRVHRDLSTSRVITTDFISGVAVDGEEVLALPQERRNALGVAYLDLYMRELFEFHLVQTDPHFGNYRVQIDKSGQDRLVLFDFGAMREVPESFLLSYAKVMQGGLERNPDLIEAAGREMKILLPDDPKDLIERYVNLCILITEPFNQGVYDWGTSDLPKRVAQKGSEIVFGHHLRAPPPETIFLDRKLGGAFVFLSVLNCRLDARPLLMKYLKFK